MKSEENGWVPRIRSFTTHQPGVVKVMSTNDMVCCSHHAIADVLLRASDYKALGTFQIRGSDFTLYFLCHINDYAKIIMVNRNLKPEMCPQIHPEEFYAIKDELKGLPFHIVETKP
jgi:hypothetical protein